MIKQSCHESHTATAAPMNFARCVERILVDRQNEESEQPRFKVAWVVAMQGADVMALVCIGKISGHGTYTDQLPSSSKHENPEGLTMRASKEKED